MPNWPRNYQEAVALQQALRPQVQLTPLARPPRLVGGADAAYDREERCIFGAIAVYSYPALELVEEAGAMAPCPFPYIPGLLSFREIPVLLSVWATLRQRPEVLLVDGQGIAHPRGLGLASHLGLLLHTPTIGVAKSRLVGEVAEPKITKGAYCPLVWEGREIGVILRSRAKTKPLYLSPGHLLTLKDCLEITLACLTHFRLPLPLRQADLLSRRLRALYRTETRAAAQNQSR